MTPSIDNPRAKSRRGRRFLSPAEKATAHNIALDAGIRKYGPKCYLYTDRCAEAWNFFQEHPELREEPEQETPTTGEAL